MISDKRSVQDLLDLLKAHDIKDVVVSPGSRNAPLSISFEADDFFNVFNIVDERSAAFFALGMSQQSGKPVVITCTSGSAALNYAPAIAEAYYQKIPLIAITADRPAHWIDQGDGQTIQQKDVFGPHVLYSNQLDGNEMDDESSWFNSRIINEAIHKATGEIKGPVHLNIPFREPLYGTVQKKRKDKAKLVKATATGTMIGPENLASLQEELNSAPRILVLCGLLPRDKELEEMLSLFASSNRVAVLTETTSNLNGKKFISTIDRLIMTFDQKDVEKFKPDLLLTIGNQLISKKIKALLRKHPPSEHWHIGREHGLLDTFKCLSRQIEVSPRVFFTQVGICTDAKRSYSEWILERDKKNQSNAEKFIRKAPYSDLKVFNELLPKIPEGSNLQMGNSSVVRYIQLFNLDGAISCNGNRGTSGIDGSTSTAFGAAWERRKNTTLISGDLSFLYDSNALWMNYQSNYLRIIVINNGGGGIFKIIDGPSTTPYLSKHFESKHKLSVKELAKHAGLRYKLSAKENELEDGIKWLYRGRKPGILEIRTAEIENESVLKDYFKYLKDHK